MSSVVNHANSGKLVLGICNGFQVLTEVGLLPGALTRNRDLHFICDRLPIKVENNQLNWTKKYQSQEILTLPIAHGEGRYYADDNTLKELEENQQIIFRYCSKNGEINEENNPNGSSENIAGISNTKGNVLGMMPHPERSSDSGLGFVDGLNLFQSLI
jgi:phosphoribosylformylglycinamidine synthase